MFEGDEVRTFWRLTSRVQTVDEVGVALDSLLNGAGKLSGAVLCSVVPAMSASWSAALERHAPRAVAEVTADSARGQLEIRVPDPRSVGADRIANAIGVSARHGTPAIVVDLGTATTFDCVSADGAYIGGIIAPGVTTSAEELYRRAARLARVEIRRPPHALGRTTEEALQAGLLWGHAGQIDALVRRLTPEIGGTPHVIATGGWAKAIAPECETVQKVDEALTLHGMRILWERTR
jgi:type III pantothenate kinase